MGICEHCGAVGVQTKLICEEHVCEECEYYIEYEEITEEGE